MKLYLVRHGDAVSESVDAERPLSSRGRADVEKVARLLEHSGVRVANVMHSGKTRARQTAEILSSRMAGNAIPEQADGLSPGDEVEPWAYQCRSFTDHTMIVGHLPFMGRLVSRLLTGSGTDGLVDFYPGAVACLERHGEQNWILTALISPTFA